MSIDVPAMNENEKKGEEDPDNEIVMPDNDSDEEDKYDDGHAEYYFFHVCLTLVCSYNFMT